MEYFDIHCHLIPGVDDGSKNMKESLATLKEEYDQNVRRIICTPHVNAKTTMEVAVNMRTTFEELKCRLKKTTFGDNMELYFGCELMYSESLAEKLDSGEIWTLAETSYILIEFIPFVSYEELYGAVRRLVSSGYLPILAHIERYECLYKKIDRIRELQDLGAYCQINSSSLQGGIWNKRTAFIKKLCKSGLIHFLATDSHGMNYRKPDMKKGAEWVVHNCEEQWKHKVLYQNGLDLINDIII